MNPMTWEQYQASRANGWSDDDLAQQGYEIPQAPERQKPGLPGAAPVDATGPRAGGGGLQPVADAARMFGQGATFGWGDEATAAVRSLGPNTTYKQAASEEQGKVDAARRNLGGLATAAELAGSFAVPGLGVEAAVTKGAKVATRGAQLGKQIVAGTAAGGISGALSGAGQARTGEKVEGGVSGGKSGALLGLFLSSALPAARQIARYAGLRHGITTSEKVSDALQDANERQGYKPTLDDTRRQVVDVMQKNRDPASGKRLMDASREMQELSVDASRANKTVERDLEAFTKGRTKTQNNDLVGDAAEALGLPAVVNAGQRSDKIGATLKQFEDGAYGPLFAAHPGEITTPAARKAWNTTIDRLRPYAKELDAIQEIADEPLSDVLVNGVPTLEGFHRLKSSIGGAVRGLEGKKAIGGLNPRETRQLRALSKFQGRLRDVIDGTPAGQDYALIQKVGSDMRRQQELLSEGGDLTRGAMDKYTATKARSGAQQSLGSAGERELRIGATSQLADEAAQTTRGGQGFLDRMSDQQATEETIGALAPTKAHADKFLDRMSDRRAMAETNALQKSKATGQKEILKGARARSTALAFGEAGGWGSFLTGNMPKGSGSLALGAMVAKAMEGRRAKSTEDAAAAIAKLLKGGPGDAKTMLPYEMLATYLERLQRSRIAGGAAASAALVPFANRY